MSNNYLNIEVTSDYKYISQDSIADVITSDMLDFQAYFQSGDWLDSEIEQIQKELVETGKVFAKNQGLSEGFIVKTDKKGKIRVNTGNLVKSIKAEPINSARGKGIKFYNDATNDRGLYAGHIEYGFHDRGGNFIPARPFMRPALYAVAEGSKANLSNVMKGLLSLLWQDGGYQGVSNLSFGRKSQHKGSTFWSSSKSFSKALSGQSGFKKLRESSHRNKMSLMNPRNKNAKKRKNGFRIKSNRDDFSGLKGLKDKKTKSSSKNKPKKNSSKQNKKQNKKKSNKPKNKQKPKKTVKRKSNREKFKNMKNKDFISMIYR